jgi:hypothetical protein
MTIAVKLLLNRLGRVVLSSCRIEREELVVGKKVDEDFRQADPIRTLAVVAVLVLMGLLPIGLRVLGPLLSNDPLKGIALAAAVIAVATTPLAFAVLGRMDWFQARRGRTYQRPEFWSVCCGMGLVMGIPAIFAALLLKSGEFDKNRYEFDPNKTWSVLEQGRSYASVVDADNAVKVEMARLAEERKNLLNNMKGLDESMLALRAASSGAPAVAQAMPEVLQRLAKVRQSVGLDGPQQLMDFTAPPADIRGATVAANIPPAPGASAAPSVATESVTAPSPVPAGVLSKAIADAEIDSVPAPQKPLAQMLPMVDLPPGWTIGKSGTKHLETFNAENLFEKIDGRAESFIQYDVKGMAYTYFHPTGDESNEVQLYIFQLASPLKALGKYGSEKPEGVTVVPVGTEGYTSAGSTLFHAGPYYTQIVSTKDDAKFSAFALDLAKRIAAKQKPEAAVAGGKPVSTPDALFALLPAGQGRSAPKYVAQDVFGYSFLSDVFMADYKEGEATWQGFLRPYPTPEAAKAVFDKYVSTAKQDGAEIKTPKADGIDQFVLSANTGLIDAIFRKGNVIGGANGGTDAAKTEAFAKTIAKGLPATLPPLESDLKGPDAAKPPKSAEESEK